MKLFRLLGFLSVMLTCGFAYGSNVKTDYDKSFDFARLKTFTFRSEWKKDIYVANGGERSNLPEGRSS